MFSSAGVGINKLTAKLAGSWKKPNQQTVVFPGPSGSDRLVASLPSIKHIPGKTYFCAQVAELKIVTKYCFSLCDPRIIHVRCHHFKAKGLLIYY